MDEREAKSVESLLRLAKFAIIAMLVIGGSLNSSALLGLV